MDNGQISRLPNPNMSCAEIEALLDSYVDGEIDPQTKRIFDRHLAKCESCNSLVLDCQHIAIVARSLGENQMPADVRSRLHQRLAEEMASSEKRPKLRLIDIVPK